MSSTFCWTMIGAGLIGLMIVFYYKCCKKAVIYPDPEPREFSELVESTSVFLLNYGGELACYRHKLEFRNCRVNSVILHSPDCKIMKTEVLIYVYLAHRNGDEEVTIEPENMSVDLSKLNKWGDVYVESVTYDFNTKLCQVVYNEE
jgi:hypothetical protein